jgi:hypothetical protein
MVSSVIKCPYYPRDSALLVRIVFVIANVVLSNSGALVDQSNSVQVSVFDLKARSRRGGLSGVDMILYNVTTIECNAVHFQ